MANCSDYISADDLKTAKQAVSHITHVAKSENSNGQHALSVTDNIGGSQVTNLTLDGMEAQFQTDQAERETVFVASQADKEERFQQFLLSSGYQFLGDYEDGPYTITELNQVIRYNGELWRLNAATNPPYTTTGTNSTSWATDVTHLVSVGDAALRQNLGSSESYLGGGLVAVDPRKTYLAGSIGKFIANMFDEGQQLQYWYDLTSNWDDAWRQAQLAVYVHGFSPKIIIPDKAIELNLPLIHGPALGDWINETYPELNFYNSSTGEYAATWPCYIQGEYRKHQDGGRNDFNGSQFVFRGSATQTDKSWMNYGIVHCAPTEIEQFRYTAAVIKKWPGCCIVRDVNIRSVNKDNSNFSTIHGILVFNGTQALIQNVSVYQVYGSGVVFDWSWDSLVENCKFVQCGRMSPDFGKYLEDGNTSVRYQTYAPVHIMRSRGTDNSNFIRIKNPHIEDCYHATADIIVSGNSSPVWLEDGHFETDTTTGVAITSSKTRLTTNWGVQYIGQDSESGFDYTTKGKPGSGGYVIWRGGATYTAGYSSLAIINEYSALIISELRVPNTGDIILNGGNASPYVIAQNCSLGNVTASGGNSNPAPVILDNVDCLDVTLDYIYASRFSNVRGRNLSITNSYNDPGRPYIFSDTTFNKAVGTVRYAQGKIALYSTTEASNFLVTHGHVDISTYSWYLNDIGASA